MRFSGTAQHKVIFTTISTTQVRATTRSMSKKVRRFLLAGRVVRKKVTRATQERLETTMESRQKITSTAAAIPRVIWSDPSVWSSLNVIN